jgi:hypothetical protein
MFNLSHAKHSPIPCTENISHEIFVFSLFFFTSLLISFFLFSLFLLSHFSTFSVLISPVSFLSVEPSLEVAKFLRDANINKVIVGHQPRGDAPLVIDLGTGVQVRREREGVREREGERHRERGRWEAERDEGKREGGMMQ